MRCLLLYFRTVFLLPSTESSNWEKWPSATRLFKCSRMTIIHTLIDTHHNINIQQKHRLCFKCLYCGAVYYMYNIHVCECALWRHKCVVCWCESALSSVRFVRCVLCAVCESALASVRCTMYCAVCRVLCAMCCVQCEPTPSSVRFTCAVCHVLHTVRSMLCVMLSLVKHELQWALRFFVLSAIYVPCQI